MSKPRKTKKQTARDALEDAGTEILLRELAAHAEALRNFHADLVKPSNDPEYLRRLQEADAARSYIANKITQIDIVPDGHRSYLGVGSFKHHEALELAEKLAEHFEAKIRKHEAAA